MIALDSLPVAVTALPLGIAFGAILERVGLGDASVIGAQFTGRDFTVVRVMFGAIVTAMLGVVWLGAAGWIDVSAIAMPPTDAAAQALGAVIFGGGFALAALCPGTACVAMSSGRRDGLAAVGGLLLGTGITPIVWPALGTVAEKVPREGARLTDDLGLPLWTIVLGITVLGVAVSMIVRRVERRGSSAWWRLTRIECVALALAAAFGLVDARPVFSSAQETTLASQISQEEDHVGAIQLATWIRDRRAGLRVVDVRDGLDSTDYRIPGAEWIPLERLPALRVTPHDHLVLYSDGGTHAAQAWVLLRARGVTDVLVLKDGMAAWEDEVMAPHPPATPDDSARKRFDAARDLALWFGGRPAIGPAAAETGGDRAAPPRRRKNRC